jgi:hypothetical protein
VIAKLQQFVYNQLIKLDNLKFLKGIFFTVPAGTNFPYLVVGDFISKDISCHSFEASEIYFSITLYHREKSQKHILNIVNQFKNNVQSNALDGIISIKLMEEKIITQNDAITQSYIMKFKALMITYT